MTVSLRWYYPDQVQWVCSQPCPRLPRTKHPKPAKRLQRTDQKLLPETMYEKIGKDSRKIEAHFSKWHFSGRKFFFFPILVVQSGILTLDHSFCARCRFQASLGTVGFLRFLRASVVHQFTTEARRARRPVVQNVRRNSFFGAPAFPPKLENFSRCEMARMLQ